LHGYPDSAVTIDDIEAWAPTYTTSINTEKRMRLKKRPPAQSPMEKKMNQIILQDVNSLKAYPSNARKHNDKQIEKIAASIKKFGFNNPILVDSSNMIIAGHGRWQAAKQLKLEQTPTLCLDHLTEDEVRAYVLADNKLAELAHWDKEILAIELQHLTSLELDFDIEITGFEIGEIDFLIDGDSHSALDPADELVVPDRERIAETQLGDLWELGKHRLFCGNSLDDKSYQQLMQGTQAQMIFTDPPYNVPIDRHVCGKGSIKHREFEMASGEMSEAEFKNFLHTNMMLVKKYSSPHAIAFYCMDWRHMKEMLDAAEQTRYELKNLCVWVKNNGGMGSLYRSKHELVFVFRVGNEQHINNVLLGKYGRYRTNVWEYAGINTFRKDRMEELAMHPTVKPVNLIADAIKDCSKRGGIILDTFGGSGTTLLAAQKTGRCARLIELDPHYCDVIVKRWEKMTGERAIKMRAGHDQT
jgi:DNA modification methylase